MKWPTYSPDESIDPWPATAMLTGIAMKSRGYNYPASWEYEYGLWELGWSREDAALSYEIGPAAFDWSNRETYRHEWQFKVSWA